MTVLGLFEQPRTKPAYLHSQLPVVLASDPGLARFLRGLDEMASELYDRVGQKEYLFDSGLAPLPIVRRLAAQIGVTIDPLLADSEQRRIARVAAATFPIRGTRESLERNLEALTGLPVRVDDPSRISEFTAPRTAPTTQPIGDGSGSSTDGVPTIDDGMPDGGEPSSDEAAAQQERGEPGSGTGAAALGDQQAASGGLASTRAVTIHLEGPGRATSASVMAVVRREVDCAVVVEFEPALPEPEGGGA